MRLPPAAGAAPDPGPIVNRYITLLAARAPLLLALGVCIGLVVPSLSSIARPLLGPSIWLLLVISALRIDPSQAAGTVRRPVPVIAALCWMLFITPLLCWAVVGGLNGNSWLSVGLVTALVLMAATSPLMSTPALSQILGLDDAFAMMVLVLGSLALPFTAPAVALHLLGLDLGIDALAWSIDLTLFIGSAVAAGIVLRLFLKADRIAQAKGFLDLAIVFFLLTFAVAIMDGVADRLERETAFVLSVAGLAFASYVVLLLAGTIYGRLFGARIGATLGFVNANRNVGIFLAVLPAGAHPDIFLYFALWQLPMYMMPAVLKPVYRRLSL